MVLVAVACAAISIIFCMALQGVSKLYAKFLKNPYIRIVAASAIIIVITLFLRTSDYMGAGNNLIELAVENGQARPLDFFWKLVLTALTMRAGFRGGEIVPSRNGFGNSDPDDAARFSDGRPRKSPLSFETRPFSRSRAGAHHVYRSQIHSHSDGRNGAYHQCAEGAGRRF